MRALRSFHFLPAMPTENDAAPSVQTMNKTSGHQEDRHIHTAAMGIATLVHAAIVHLA